VTALRCFDPACAPDGATKVRRWNTRRFDLRADGPLHRSGTLHRAGRPCHRARRRQRDRLGPSVTCTYSGTTKPIRSRYRTVPPPRTRNATAPRQMSARSDVRHRGCWCTAYSNEAKIKTTTAPTKASQSYFFVAFNCRPFRRAAGGHVGPTFQQLRDNRPGGVAVDHRKMSGCAGKLEP
jgi:hypothetical protein